MIATLQRRSRAGIAIAMATIAIIVAMGAASAGAHTGDNAESEIPNYVTAITDSGHPGLSWSVDIAHAKIGLTNNTDQTVIVDGYQSEPYLRFDPDGQVWWNSASQAATSTKTATATPTFH